MVLRGDRASSQISNKTYLRGMVAGETKKLTTFGSKDPFWQFATILNFGFENVCWTTPNVSPFKCVEIRLESLADYFIWCQTIVLTGILLHMWTA